MTTSIAPRARLRLPAVRNAIQEMAWPMKESHLHALIEIVEAHAAYGGFTAEEIQARISDKQRPVSKSVGKIAVLDLYGPISQRMSLFAEISGGTSAERFANEFDAAMADPDVGAIVLNVDSPGGNVAGTPELAKRIFDARGKGKQIIAVANTLMASAAYWIASAADEIVATPSAEVGSIGVFAVHMDTSEADAKDGIKYTLIKAGKFKAETVPFQPLSEEAMAAQQAMVDEFYTMFVNAVAKHRGVKASDVKNGYGEGRTLTAKGARDAGLVDRIATLEETLQRLGASNVGMSGRPRSEASATTSTIEVHDVAPADATSIDDSAETTRPHEAKEHDMPVETGTPAQNGADSNAAIAAERARAKEIRALGESLANLGVTTEMVNAQIDAGVTVAQASVAFASAVTQRHATTPNIRVGVDRETEKPFRSFGEQLTAIIQAGRPAGRVDPRLNRVNAEAMRIVAGTPSGMNESVGSEGGFFIQPDLLPGVIDPVYAEDPILSRVTRIPIGANSNGVRYNVVDETARTTGSRWGGIQMYWGAEADQATASKPKLRQMVLDLKKLIGLAYLTDELLVDAPAAESLLTRAFQAELSFVLASVIFKGTGAGQPQGFLNSGALVTQAIEATQTIANTAQFISANVSKMLSRVPASLWGEIIWLYNQELLPYLINATIGSSTTVPLFMTIGGLANRPQDTILGRPAFGSEMCEAVGTPGDLVAVVPSQYHMADKGGPVQAVSVHVRFLFDEQALRITYRCDGAPVWRQAVTPFKGANARSPFVALATRT